MEVYYTIILSSVYRLKIFYNEIICEISFQVSIFYKNHLSIRRVQNKVFSKLEGSKDGQKDEPCYRCNLVPFTNVPENQHILQRKK